MKKVLFTATVDSHILHFHLPFLKYFKDNGYEVHVATNGDEEIPYCDIKHKVSFERSPLKIKNLKAIKQLKKICNEEKFDIIHTHTPMGSVVTRLAAKKSRKKYNTKVIYTAHGFHFFKGASIKNWMLFYPVEKWLSKYTDILITINLEDYNLALKKFKRRCKDIEYVPGVGIDRKKFDFELTEEQKIELRESLGLKKDDFVLIYPARLDLNKNHSFLINSMKKIIDKDNNIHLVLAGLDELNGKYQELAKQLNVDNNIHFLGYRKDIPSLLKISNISVSSSLREGLPVNVIEGFAAGLPVVALKCRGMNDLIENEKNGFIVLNEEEFIDKIFLLKNNEEIYDEIKSNNLVKVEKYYIENIIKKMETIYKLK